MARAGMEKTPEDRWFLMEAPVALNSLVTYRGRNAVVVGRAKPVGGAWRYDLRVEHGLQRDIVTGITPVEFSPAPIRITGG